MDKKRVGIAVAILVFAVGGYIIYSKFIAKGGETAEREAPNEKKPTEVAKSERVPPPNPTGQQSAVSMDDDPDGPLRLEGQVVDGQDQGVPGARVTLNSNPPRTITAEGDGTFAFDKLIGRTYFISARAGDEIGGPVAYKLTSEQSAPAIIRMRSGGSVSVVVRGQASGQPVEGATVEMRDMDVRTQTVDKEGRTTFGGVGAGWFVVVARSPGYGAARQSLLMPSTPGAKLTVELAMTAGASISGTVTGDGGAPLADAVVTAHRVGNVFDGINPRYDGVKTDASGAFQIDAVAIGKVQLRADHRDYAGARSDVIDLSSDQSGVTIALERGGLIRGRVVTSGGEAVAWANVAVSPEGDPSAMWGGGNRGTTADEKGVFEIKGLPRSKMNLLASSELASSEVATADLAVKAEETGLDLVLTITGTISGRVVDSDGAELAEVQVVLTPDWTSGVDNKRLGLSQGDSATTSGDGRFVFAGLPDGVYLLKPTRDAGSPLFWQAEGTRAKTGDSEIVLVLPKNGSIKGSVVAQNGKPIETFTVTVGFPPGHPFADAGGDFELSAIPPGKYDIKIRGEDFGITTVADVVVKPSETTDVGSVSVVRGRVLSGRVVDKGGSGIAGAEIVMAGQLVGSSESLSFSTDPAMDEMMQIRRGKTDDDGAFRIRGVSKVELVVAAEHPLHGRSRPSVLAKGEADSQMTLILLPQGSVTGVVKRGGVVAPGTNVIATPSEARLQMAVTQSDDKGTYNLASLAEGSYEISASFGSGFTQQTITRKLTVKGGEKHEVDLLFVPGELTLTVTVTPEPDAKVDATQLFLFPRKVVVKNARDLYDAALGEESSGSAQSFSMKGAPVAFKDLDPGLKTICGLPITGDMQDQQFMQRLQEHAIELKVVCKELVMPESPLEQTAELVVPEMEPLPAPPSAP